MEQHDLNKRVIQAIKNDNQDEINLIIGEYTPFILNTISVQKNSYVSLGDDEFSVGMGAFYDAMKKYDPERGHFLIFAKVVITSKLKTYWTKQNKHRHISLDDENSNISLEAKQEDADLKEEIVLFEQELNKFGMDYEMLVDNTPKHRDTKQRANEIGIKTSSEQDFIDHLYEKKRLPITKMAERFFVSVKIIKKSKYYIMAVVIAIVKKFDLITNWIKTK